MSMCDLKDKIADLQAEIERLTIINDTLIERVESAIDETGSAFAMFKRNSLLEQHIKDRTKDLEAMNRDLRKEVSERIRAEQDFLRLRAAVEQAAEGFVITDTCGLIQYVSPAVLQMFGYFHEEVIGKTVDSFDSSMDAKIFSERMQVLQQGGIWKGRVNTHHKDGSAIQVEETVSPVRDPLGNVTNYVSVIRDVTKEIHLETQLRNAQKLESIGQLAAGIAHEINTPTQYVGDNTRFLDDSLSEVFKLVFAYQSLITAIERDGQHAELVSSVRQIETDVDLQFLITEMPSALEHSLEGISRISHIVKAMKEFSHPGTASAILTDINKAIESTATVARSEWRYVANMEFSLDPNLPLVPCFPGDFNQVILNMIVNAAHAIAEKIGNNSGQLGFIKISTKREGESAVIHIQDSGNGIPESIVDRIFDPFFTTKGIGKGTGQGLALARSVIVDRHHGTVACDSVRGQGATFIITLPLKVQKNDNENTHSLC